MRHVIELGPSSIPPALIANRAAAGAIERCSPGVAAIIELATGVTALRKTNAPIIRTAIEREGGRAKEEKGARIARGPRHPEVRVAERTPKESRYLIINRVASENPREFGRA